MRLVCLHPPTHMYRRIGMCSERLLFKKQQTHRKRMQIGLHTQTHLDEYGKVTVGTFFKSINLQKRIVIYKQWSPIGQRIN